MSEPVPDVLIVGAGIAGLATAYALACREVSVTVLERERAGARASWAGAGMLNCRPHPRHHPGTDYSDLMIESLKLHEKWAAQLLEETEIDAGYRRCGALEVFTPQRLEEEPEALPSLLEGCAARGFPTEKLTPEEAGKLEPQLDTSRLATAVYLPHDGQVRTPRFSRALALACRQREVKIKEGVAVADVLVENGKAVGVVGTDGTRHFGGKVVFCAGAWTGQFKQLVELAPAVGKIQPVRGQIVCFKLSTPPCKSLITAHEHYVVSRPDGVVLTGSVTEFAGFDAVTTPESQTLLREFAGALLPLLKNAEPVQGWADLRPGLKGRHPILGPVAGVENLFVAAGHYRNGIILGPVTGEIMAALILGQKPLLPVEHYYPQKPQRGKKGQNYS